MNSNLRRRVITVYKINQYLRERFRPAPLVEVTSADVGRALSHWAHGEYIPLDTVSDGIIPREDAEEGFVPFRKDGSRLSLGLQRRVRKRRHVTRHRSGPHFEIIRGKRRIERFRYGRAKWGRTTLTHFHKQVIQQCTEQAY